MIAGQSSGGYTAQRFAIDHPDRTLGLVSDRHPARLPRTSPQAWEFLRALPELTDPVDPEFVRGVMTATITRPLPPALLETLITESAKVPARVWQATFHGLLEAEVPTETGTITAPTLILWGDQDELAPRGDQAALQAAIAGAELVVYHATGHAVACEQPARTAADLAAFARRVGSTA